MNIATQAESLFQGLLEKNPKWVEPLLSRYLPTALVALLVVLIGSQAAELTWRLIPTPAGVNNVPQPVATAPQTGADRDGESLHLASAANLHLFGVAGVTKPVARVDMKAPETRLNLTLHGVFVDEDPQKGAAIIGTSGSTQKYYRVGAEIMNGVKLQGVFNDRVVLLRNGQSEVLRFPKPSSSGSNVISPLRGNAIRSSSVSNNAAATSLRDYREEFQKQPLKIFEHVRFVPVRSRDGLKGYRVLPQKNRDLYNRLGIRPSDLVTSVNGITLTNDQEAMKLIDTLKDASSIQVDIVRNGQPQSLTFSLN
ncbi:MAG: type II secretion system protein GspC [Candidatus Thiodiazotropha sp.]